MENLKIRFQMRDKCYYMFIVVARGLFYICVKFFRDEYEISNRVNIV